MLCVVLGVGNGILSADDMAFLDGLAASVVEASRVTPGAKVDAFGPNTSGGTLIRPGGRACYPAFWIRDYAMSLDSGKVTVDEQRHALLLTASFQQDVERALPSGSRLPVGAIPDHITFDGKGIFYPGTLDDVNGQGGPAWGAIPPLDDQFYFIHMAWALVHGGGDEVKVLDQAVNGQSLWNRLEAAFRMPPARESGVVYADADNRGITFGFVDSITHTGDLLFASLLKWQAAKELEWLFKKAGRVERAREYARAAKKLQHAIVETFVMESGWLRSSTGVSGQPDVWGTAYAVHLGALPRKLEKKACLILTEAYRKGDIAWKGSIRHVPCSGDFGPATAWEKALSPKNRYQNGAYWGTPTGWVCRAVVEVDLEAARALAAEYIAELREGDFRKGPAFGSPWECAHPDGDHRQNPVYMTSVTCPLAAFRTPLSASGR